MYKVLLKQKRNGRWIWALSYNKRIKAQSKGDYISKSAAKRSWLDIQKSLVDKPVYIFD